MVRNVRRPLDAPSHIARARKLEQLGLMEMPNNKGDIVPVSISAFQQAMWREMAVYDMLPKAVRDGLKEGDTKGLEKWIEEQKELRSNEARAELDTVAGRAARD